jgi:predicted GNAT superfamily acetyltransferase
VLAGKPLEQGDVQGKIEVPNDVAAIRASNPERARAIQEGVSDKFEKYLDQGLAVIGFEKTDTTGNYLIGRFQKP